MKLILIVPEDKIISRYYRSIDNLLEVIKWTDRCYIFDNSISNARVWIAEITDGVDLEFKVKEIPEWFFNILNKKEIF